MKLFKIVFIFNALALLVMCDNLEFLDSSESRENGETNQANETMIDVSLKNRTLNTGEQIFLNVNKI
jgi:hypothetical protein